ncbi:MAG: carboxylating nicotinate-nucleotide diphosphorylase [Melioribacteraceae bacterium]
MKLNRKELDRIISEALREDIGSGDVTTDLIVPSTTVSEAFMIAKEDGILAGLPIAKTVFKKLDKKIFWKNLVKEGEHISAGTEIVRLKGSYRSLLTGERTALNFLQRISGIATTTSKYVEKLEGLKTVILDTRKTAPGLRMLDKYGVKIGGGTNHRIGLYDMVLIKDNHIKAAGGIFEAVIQIKNNLTGKMKIEVEVTNLAEVEIAMNAGADILMLDNMSIKQMNEAVKLIDGKVKVEASGGVNLNTVRAIAETGVDFISVGALTHSVKALDISMNFKN